MNMLQLKSVQLLINKSTDVPCTRLKEIKIIKSLSLKCKLVVICAMRKDWTKGSTIWML
jgi:hypothetical protein